MTQRRCRKCAMTLQEILLAMTLASILGGTALTVSLQTWKEMRQAAAHLHHCQEASVLRIRWRRLVHPLPTTEWAATPAGVTTRDVHITVENHEIRCTQGQITEHFSVPRGIDAVVTPEPVPEGGVVLTLQLTWPLKYDCGHPLQQVRIVAKPQGDAS